MSSEPSLRPIDLDPLRADPLVSVLIPVKNYGRYIGDAIQSVLAGSYANLELIVCDDGSTDESLAVIRNYARTDERIKVIEKTNGGQASALNTAFANCRGAIICILDADDTFHPDKLSRVADYYQTLHESSHKHRCSAKWAVRSSKSLLALERSIVRKVSLSNQ